MSSSTQDLGLLVLRVGSGGVLFVHGAQKLFGWFGGDGLDATAAIFDEVGFRPGKANAIAAGLTEAGGGALLAAGLATHAAGAAVAGTMAVATSFHVPQGFFWNKGGLEFPAVLGVTAATLALTGPGEFSIDALLGHRVNRSWMRNVALGAVVPAVAGVVLRRRRALAAVAASASVASPTGSTSASVGSGGPEPA